MRGEVRTGVRVMYGFMRAWAARMEERERGGQVEGSAILSRIRSDWDGVGGREGGGTRDVSGRYI